MRNLNNYYGNIDLMMDGYMVKPCICNGVNQRHYIVYKPNYEYWKDAVEHEGELRAVDFDNIIHEWIPVCKIYGYSDKFYELDEICYLVQKCRRWEIMAGKSGICLLDKWYHDAGEEPFTPIEWRIDFIGLDENAFYEPSEHGYKLMDVKYKEN